MKKFNITCGLMMAGLMSASAAHADSFGEHITQTRTIVFAQAADSLTLDIAVASGLESHSLADKQLIATSKAYAGDSARAGIRFSNSANQVVSGSSGNWGNLVTISGENDPNNKLKLSMGGAGTFTQGKWISVGDDTYYVENAPGDDSMNYVANGAQTVPADNYVLSLDAAVYNP